MAYIEVYVGLGTQRREVWSGNVEAVPRVGEQVTWDNGDSCGQVQRVTHWLQKSKNKPSYVEVYVR
jgi:hypothetical protein